jgi:hypothetical protein
MSIFIYRPEAGYSPLNIIMAIIAMTVSFVLFSAGKKFITLPRMGQVQFGEQRKKRKRTMIIVGGALILIQVVLLAIQLAAWARPDVGASVNGFIQDRNAMDLLVASIGTLMVGLGMTVSAYFTDFPRGYFIAVMMSLAVFLMIYLNQPVYPIVIGLLIALPGLVLFIRFLQKYPLQHTGVSHE